MKTGIILFLICFNSLCKPSAVRDSSSAASNNGGSHSAKYTLSNNSDTVCPDDVVAFAKTLLGTHYQYASSNPLYGFDCSGFVNYVFKNFNIPVPRSSYDFISVGEKVDLKNAKTGDIILFTGTDPHSRTIGHIGIITFNQNNEVKFIHATSGKESAVTISNLDERYRQRFVQVVRLLKQNDMN